MFAKGALLVIVATMILVTKCSCENDASYHVRDALQQSVAASGHDDNPLGYGLVRALDENDLCDDAEALQIGGGETEGTTIDTGDDVSFCENNGNTNNTATGVWYKVIGSGARLWAGTRQSVLVHVSVFESNCASLVCVGNSSISFGEVEWISDLGVEYKILVQRNSARASDPHETFRISIASGPMNDFCNNAEMLQIGIPTNGTTAFSGGGVFYKVIGNGGGLQAFTHAYDEAFELFIYKGTCGDLEQIGGGQNWDGGLRTWANWRSESGTEYLVYVRNPDYPGRFAITILTARANDMCDDAETLQVDTWAEGTIVDGGYDNVGYCGTSNEAPGIWYTVVGTGGNLLAMQRGGGGPARVSVFEGGCEDLACIGGVDYDDFQDGVAWQSESGVEYFILVHQHPYLQDVVSIRIIVYDAPANDLCDDAETLELDTPMGATTRAAGLDDVGSCGTSSEDVGVWYKIMGNGFRLQATNNCSMYGPYTTISVFEGTCDDLVCVEAVEGDDWCENSSLEWKSESGTEYFILLRSHQFFGYFEITITSVPTIAPTNSPTNMPTNSPTNTPTNAPTNTPTIAPTNVPTNVPTIAPTNEPTITYSPTDTPTDAPTNIPSNAPTAVPTNTPTNFPTERPTNSPTVAPTELPTEEGSCRSRFACKTKKNGEIVRYWMYKESQTKCVKRKKVRRRKKKGWICGRRTESASQQQQPQKTLSGNNEKSNNNFGVTHGILDENVFNHRKGNSL